MRIAIQNSFPNIPQSAEAEWIRRALVACDRLGHEAIETVTSDDILSVQPDCVLLTHEFSPKLTAFPTLALMWSPHAFYAEDPVRRRTILSHDAHLCGSEQIVQWIDDYLTGCGKRPVIADHLMLPSTPDQGPAGPLPDRLSIMYAGLHWDGTRHGAVFRALQGRVPLRLYGPPHIWQSHRDEYAGTLPFDGTSVLGALREAGVALCLHKAAHRAANCPSMRLFEAAAAGALIICDDFEFPRQWFRDSVLYVDADLPAPLVADQVAAHMDWARRNPASASKLAARSNALFRHNLTLETMLRPLPAVVDRTRIARGMVSVRALEGKPSPTVEYVIRIGSRSATTLARTLGSLVAQSYPAIAVTLVQFHPVEGLTDLIAKVEDRFRWINHIVVPNNGNRGTSWWAGLNASSAEYVAFLDDDDTLLPNHVESIMTVFDRKPDVGFVYTGLIRIQDEPGHYFSLPNFNGPRNEVIEERRELFACSVEEFDDFSPLRNVIGHNAWICRRSLITEDVLRDPRIEYAEDVLFVVLMAGLTPFAFTGMATAEWHWRSTTKDNWSLSYPAQQVEEFLARWQERTQAVRLPVRNRIAPPSGVHVAADWAARDAT